MARRVKRRYWDDGGAARLEEYRADAREYREAHLAPPRLKFWRERGEGPFVYFIYCRDANAVKIGTAKDPLARFAELQVANPYRLYLREVVVGGRSLERHLHDHFADWHIRGEWFREADAILAFAGAYAEEQVRYLHEQGRVVSPHFG